MKTLFRFCALFLLASPANAEDLVKPVMPVQAVTAIINTSTKFYWGKAVDKNGEVIRAPNAVMARQPPIPRDDAVRIVDTVGISGLAEFCKLDWKSFHDAFLAGEQKTHHWNDAQMPYVENLYEGTHAVTLSAAQHNIKCTDDIGNRVATRLTDAERQLEEGAPAMAQAAGSVPNDAAIPPVNRDGPRSYTITGSGNEYRGGDTPDGEHRSDDGDDRPGENSEAQ